MSGKRWYRVPAYLLVLAEDARTAEFAASDFAISSNTERGLEGPRIYLDEERDTEEAQD